MSLMLHPVECQAPNPTGEVRSPLAEQKAIAIRRRIQRATISVIIGI